jgi:hypothetical protein
MKIRLTFVLAAAALILSGCMFIGQSSGTVTSSDQAAFQKVFMSSYYAERGGVPGGAKGLTPFLKVTSGSQGSGSKATVPVGQLTNNNWATLSPKTLVNYPEPGQTTTFTVTTKDGANHVYDVTATTTYPSDDIRKSYVEEYYVKDVTPGNWSTPDGLWTYDDPIVSQSGGTWVQDQKARVQQVLTFTDGTTRTETIVAQSNPSGLWTTANSLYFAPPSPYRSTGSYPVNPNMDINASLDLSQVYYPALTTDPYVKFSSVVVYYVTPASNTNFWFWQGTQAKTILGIRYYTEYWDAGAQKFNSFTVAFEKTIDTLTTTGGSFSQTLATVFVGSQFNTLAESVLRQQVTYNLDVSGNLVLSSGSKVTNMQSRVVDITGQKDFYLTQTSSDYVSLSNWSTTTIYTPTGNVSEVLAGNPSAFVYSRTATQSINGSPPLAVQTVTDLAGTGDLATLYTSIQEGNAVIHTGTTIPGSIQPSGTEAQYNGSQGTTIADSSAYNLGNTGTVEAWVYINAQTDTGGIVHKGVQANFSDEAWSLQFWGNQGQVAWVIDQPTSLGANYDLLTSKINLNTGKWYYLVATWDATANPKYINLYINGTLNNSRLPSWTPNEADPTNTSAVIIGSQLPTQYNGTYGYFGFNGKINGVRISSTPMSAQTVASNYATYILQTPNW